MITITVSYIHIVAFSFTIISFVLDAYVVGAIHERKKQATVNDNQNKEEV